ncbi:MAG: hypothetical protein NTW93_01400 [Phycisphaerae bacterium]|nr:hypothetical protein [Phycisphaerae bacterium]
MKKLLLITSFVLLFLLSTISSAINDSNGLQFVKIAGECGNNFREQILSSFIGTFFGFIFAIILFILTNKLIEIRNQKVLIKHLIKELKYDITQIEGWIAEVDKILRKITAEDKRIYYYLKYSDFSRVFTQQAFNSGLLFDKLNDKEISQLNTIFLHCDINTETFVNNYITQWKSSQIERSSMLENFEYEKTCLEKYKNELIDILKKIK